MDQKTDEEIVMLVQKGNSYAFSELMGRYEKRLLLYARKFLFYDPQSAEDVIQEVFIKTYVNIRSFDAARKFSSWIYRIAHNELINTIRKRKNEHVPFFDPDTLFPHPVSKETADGELHDKEIREAMGAYLNKLDMKYREPLVLYYYEGMDYKEISEVLRIPISTVGIRLRRAKEIMKKNINSAGLL